MSGFMAQPSGVEIAILFRKASHKRWRRAEWLTAGTACATSLFVLLLSPRPVPSLESSTQYLTHRPSAEAAPMSRFQAKNILGTYIYIAFKTVLHEFQAGLSTACVRASRHERIVRQSVSQSAPFTFVRNISRPPALRDNSATLK